MAIRNVLADKNLVRHSADFYRFCSISNSQKKKVFALILLGYTENDFNP